MPDILDRVMFEKKQRDREALGFALLSFLAPFLLALPIIGVIILLYLGDQLAASLYDVAVP